jgi:hypothetical protein
MNLGHGSTRRERPRKGLENSSRSRLNFGPSSLPTGSVYRRRWADKSIFGTIIKIAVLLTILAAIIAGVVSEMTR